MTTYEVSVKRDGTVTLNGEVIGRVQRDLRHEGGTRWVATWTAFAADHLVLGWDYQRHLAVGRILTRHKARS